VASKKKQLEPTFNGDNIDMYKTRKKREEERKKQSEINI